MKLRRSIRRSGQAGKISAAPPIRFVLIITSSTVALIEIGC
jgi:hypothetical protein